MHMKQAKVGLFVLGGLMALTGCNQGDAEGGQDAVVSESEQGLTAPGCPKNTPAAIKPAANQTLALMFKGEGVQIYDCKADATGAITWVFRAPVADLKDPIFNSKIGTHYVGPTWEDKWFHSTVVAAKAAAAPAANPATDVPWLLLNTVSHGPNKGIFSEISSIQRLNTKGGQAPTTGCSAETVGAVVNVPYTADYFFYRTTTSRTVFQCGG